MLAGLLPRRRRKPFIYLKKLGGILHHAAYYMV